MATVNTLDSRTRSSDVYLDMRVDKNYEKAVNNYVKNGYADELETGKAILRELQRSPSVKFYKRTSNGGFVVVDSVGALESESSPFFMFAMTRYTLSSFANDNIPALNEQRYANVLQRSLETNRYLTTVTTHRLVIKTEVTNPVVHNPKAKRCSQECRG